MTVKTRRLDNSTSEESNIELYHITLVGSYCQVFSVARVGSNNGVRFFFFLLLPLVGGGYVTRNAGKRGRIHCFFAQPGFANNWRYMLIFCYLRCAVVTPIIALPPRCVSVCVCCQPSGRFEDDVIPFLKMIRYPFQLSRSSLAAVGAPQTWPKVGT